MSDVKHSDAPWTAECHKGEWSVVDANGEIVASISEWHHALDMEDARLIAAAPELLEALRDARRDVLQLLHGRGCEAEGTDEDWVGHIDVAIAKATGADNA